MTYVCMAINNAHKLYYTNYNKYVKDDNVLIPVHLIVLDKRL